MSIVFPKVSELRQLMRFRKLETSPVRRRLNAAVTIDDMRRIASRRTPKAVFDYVDGGAGDELSLSRNEAAFRRIEFAPRTLVDVSETSTSANVLGNLQSMPVILAPTGFTRMMHHQGEHAVARGAAEAGVPYALSTMGTASIEQMAQLLPEPSRWFQLYLWKDRAASLDFVERAKESGCGTLVLTVDTPVAGPRHRDTRNGMTIPPSLTFRTLIDGARHPHWWMNFVFREPIEFASLKKFNGTVAELTDLVFDPSITLADLEWLRENWSGKIVVKGVHTGLDADAIVGAGADAVVLSNHGGRQLDRSPVPLETLPAVADLINGRAEVYIDGGVRSGSDVAAAIALGADAVMIGRPYLYGLMAAGEAGVRHVLQIMQRELANTMKLVGASTVSELRGRGSLRPH